MVFSMSVTLFWMFSEVPKQCPLRTFFLEEQRLHRCVGAQGNYFEGDNIDDWLGIMFGGLLYMAQRPGH